MLTLGRLRRLTENLSDDTILAIESERPEYKNISGAKLTNVVLWTSGIIEKDFGQSGINSKNVQIVSLS